MKRTIVLASVAALAMSPAFAGALQPSTMAAPAAASGATAVAMMPMASHDYVMRTVQTNTAEIEAAKLAEMKSSDPEVKQFAAMMIKDHTAAQAKLKTAVESQAGMAMPAPMLAPKDAAMAKKLEASSGAAFDRMYVDGQVMGHSEALALQEDYAMHGSDAALKAYATATAKVVEGHLKHAKMLQAKLGS